MSQPPVNTWVVTYKENLIPLSTSLTQYPLYRTPASGEWWYLGMEPTILSSDRLLLVDGTSDIHVGFLPDLATPVQLGSPTCG